MPSSPVFTSESQVNPIQRWLIFAAMCLGIFMLAFATTAITNAMVPLREQMHLDYTQLQWTSSAYMLAAASCIIVSGLLSDRYGRRNMFLIGAIIYIVGSWVCATSVTAMPFIIGRLIQGVGGAIILPGTLALMKVVFDEYHQSIVTTGWACGIGLGFGLGPFLSGIFSAHFGWPYLFWFSIVIASLSVVLLVIGNHRYVPFNRDVTIDVKGLILFLLGFPSLMFVLIEGNKMGWLNPLILFMLAISFVFLGLFQWVERRTTQTPLINFKFYTNHKFLMGCVGMFINGYVLIGIFYFGNLYFQNPLLKNYNTLVAGMALLPLGSALFLSVLFVDHLTTHLRMRWCILMAFAMMLLGIMWFFFLPSDASYAVIWPVLVLIGAGCGMGFKVFPAFALSGFTPKEAARASSLVSVNMYLGAIVSMAVGTVVALVRSRQHFYFLMQSLRLSARTKVQLAGVLMGHASVLSKFLAGHHQAMIANIVKLAIRQSTMAGFHMAMMVGLLFICVGVFLSFILMLD